MIIKKSWLLTLLLGVLLLGFLIKPNNKTTMENNDLLTTKPKKQFAIWVEQNKGAKDFIEQDEFPGPGYILGEDSQCIDNTGTVVDNPMSVNEDGSVTVTSSSTAYCTLYFEIQPSIKNVQDMYESDETPLGDPEQGNDGWLIYHDGQGSYVNAEYEAGDYSYRFSGNNPDNWVCMDGGSEEGPCDITKLYRVIGAFPTDENHTQYQIKLIKSEYLTYDETEVGLNISKKASQTSPSGWVPRVENQTNVNGFYWSGSSSITWNNWLSSELNKGLNNPNGKYLQSLQPYIDAGLISDTTWYIGGNSSSKIYSQSNVKLAYDNELGTGRLTPETGANMCTQNSTSYVDCTDELLYQTNKVGLMYATEYGYAASPSRWNTQLYDYDNSETRKNNWLYNGVWEWLLTRNAGSAYYAFLVNYTGCVNFTNTYVYYNARGVRPVLVLSSAAEIQSGEGTKSGPWRIKIPTR